MNSELGKIKFNSEKYKTKLEKTTNKQPQNASSKFFNTVKELKHSKSASNLDKIVSLALKMENNKAFNINNNNNSNNLLSIEHATDLNSNNIAFISNNNLNLDLESKIQTVNGDLNALLNNTREKYASQMISVYEDMYKNVKNLKHFSIQTVNCFFF
jgi:hypothetical protein